MKIYIQNIFYVSFEWKMISKIKNHIKPYFVILFIFCTCFYTQPALIIQNNFFDDFISYFIFLHESIRFVYVSIWFLYDCTMFFLRKPYDFYAFSMIFLCFSYGCPTIFRCFSYVFPSGALWFPYDFLMCFLGMPYDFYMIFLCFA